MKNSSKIIAFIIPFVLLFSLLSGCDKTNEANKKSSDVEVAGDGKVYPMKTDYSLSIWTNRDSSSPSFAAWQERTGVKINKVANTGTEGLNLLLASGDLPDIIMHDLHILPGGVQKIVADGHIIDLTELQKKYAPNLKKYLSENPDIDKMVISDDGKYYMFPFLAETEWQGQTSGPVMRKDLLDKAGLEIPETIDEWYQALKYFKSTGASAPLSYSFYDFEHLAGILSAYGTPADFFIKNGKVSYGFLEPEMKGGISTLAKWYAEGLLDENIVKVSNLDANILSGKTCASFVWGSSIAKYNNAAAENGDAEFNLVGVPFPVLNKGDKPQFTSQDRRYMPNNSAYITKACENQELAARFLDYGYTDEGHMLFNFGVEGLTYNMIDGYPVYTDLIMKNPDGLAPTAAMGKFLINGAGPFVQDKAYLEQYYSTTQQIEAMDTWLSPGALENRIPLISFTVEESQRVGSIMNNVQTAANEHLFKFIMGIESIDNYDAFVKQIKDFGIEEAIAIYQSAVDRYHKRLQ